MADYSSDGLWEFDGVMMSRVDLPVSDSLRNRHIKWCDWYEKNDDYLPENERSTFDMIAFCREGLEIAKAVKAELPDWQVIYFDESMFDASRSDQNRKEFEYEIV
jgi:hypothetical protein